MPTERKRDQTAEFHTVNSLIPSNPTAELPRIGTNYQGVFRIVSETF